MRRMEHNTLQKLFGVGPRGAVISVLLLALSVWADQMVGHPAIASGTVPLRAIGVVLIILGLGLHLWAFSTLRTWWIDDKLCTVGPYKFFRHPMYAAWITFISSGIVLYLNSWVYFFLVLLLHPIWHRLVRKEEIIMIDTFGDAYRNYARQTGRFVPRIPNRHRIRS